MVPTSRHPRPAPRFYLATPPVADTVTLVAALPDLLERADVAAVLLRLASGDERTLTNRVKAIARVVQSKDVALLIDGHPDIAARAGADGCHLSDTEALQAAAPSIKPARILGAGGLTTRHDAMVAGEIADYVMFGEPDAEGTRPSFAAVLERVAWWAEVFEVPCVAWASLASEVEELCAAGADFVALGDAVFTDPRLLADAAIHVKARTPA